MREFLSHLKCKLATNRHFVVKVGQKPTKVYLLVKNKSAKVDVVSRTGNVLASLSTGSWFGDTPVLFDVASKYAYQIHYKKQD